VFIGLLFINFTRFGLTAVNPLRLDL